MHVYAYCLLDATCLVTCLVPSTLCLLSTLCCVVLGMVATSIAGGELCLVMAFILSLFNCRFAVIFVCRGDLSCTVIMHPDVEAEHPEATQKVNFLLRMLQCFKRYCSCCAASHCTGSLYCLHASSSWRLLLSLLVCTISTAFLTLPCCHCTAGTVPQMLDDLRYGAVVVNAWSAMSYALAGAVCACEGSLGIVADRISRRSCWHSCMQGGSCGQQSLSCCTASGMPS